MPSTTKCIRTRDVIFFFKNLCSTYVDVYTNSGGSQIQRQEQSHLLASPLVSFIPVVTSFNLGSKIFR